MISRMEFSSLWGVDYSQDERVPPWNSKKCLGDSDLAETASGMSLGFLISWGNPVKASQDFTLLVAPPYQWESRYDSQSSSNVKGLFSSMEEERGNSYHCRNEPGAHINF